jgi:hypothetical protein
MLVVRSKGQLGNQLFLFAAAMKAREPQEKVFFIGFQELAQSFPQFAKRFWRLPLRRSPLWLWRLSDRAMSKLATWAALGRVSLAEGSDTFERRKGKMPIAIFDAGLCQRESLIDSSSVLSLVSAQYYENHNFPLGSGETYSQEHHGQEMCFVHVRRGDYLRWPSISEPAALPDSWFLDAMKDMEKESPAVRFAIVTDDPSHCEEVFGQRENCTVITLDEAATLRFMSTCDAGILSASTFSFWGAWLASQKEGKIFIAPEFWVGWREKSWYPTGIEDASFLTWRRVKV